MRATWRRPAALIVGALLLSPLAFGGCNLGPFPDFLEPLDPLRPVEGDVKGWILAGDDQTHVLILSQSGRFLHSQVGRDTSVWLETGSFEIDGNELVMRSEYRYEFPKESGPVKDRAGAQSMRLDEKDSEKRRPAQQEEERLTIEGWGTFISTSDYVLGLDLETRDGRGCLLKYIQLSIRTIQARIRSFGGAGTVMYNNNKSSFVGFISGEQTIVVENITSPDTTIAYYDFQDFPEVQLDGSLVSHVNTSGDGTLDEFVSFQVFDTSRAAEVGLDSGAGGGGSESVSGSSGANGMGGALTEQEVLASGRLIYGPSEPIRIEHADVMGGSYDLEITQPSFSSDNFSWEFLEDLDLRQCSVFADE